MNIAFFMKPKAEITYVYSDDTVRQAVERINMSKFTAVPILDREGRYVGTLRDGDLLWFIIRGEGGEPHTMAVESLEKFRVSEITLSRSEPTAKITDSVEDLIASALQANFVPVVDDRGLFIGIITRSAIIRYYYETYMLTGKKYDHEEAVKALAALSE